MSDERLRELERRVRAGETGARVEWLRERLRAGQLDPERLELAARCGDPAAREVLGGEPAELDARELADQLLLRGREASVRAALGLALSPTNARALARYSSKLYGHALSAALRTLERPADPEARRKAAAQARVDPELTSVHWTNSREGLYALAAAAAAGAEEPASARQALFAHIHAAIDPSQIPDHPDPHQGRWTPLQETDEALALFLRGLDARPDLLDPLCLGLAAWALGDLPSHSADGLADDLPALKR